MILFEQTQSPPPSAQLIDSNVRVAGIKFRVTALQGFIKEIDGLDPETGIVGLDLIKDQNNDYDPNAIKVMGYTRTDEQTRSSAFHIGFLPKALAHKLNEDGVKTNQLFAEFTKMTEKSPKVILDLYKV